MQAHLCVLHQIITDNHCESVTYLSSTRVYSGLDRTEEDRSLLVNPLHLSDLYNLSKLSGESLCLNSGIPARIVRLSNVYGHSENPNFDSPLFIPALLRESVLEKKLVFRSAPTSAKDYIHVEDAAQLILLIASKGKSKIYNVASGQNISNVQIADVLYQRGTEVEFLPGAESIWFHPIDINRILSEFFAPRHCLLNDIPELLNVFREHFQP
jgi:nucleoside-diphosphate-sugar epimerase